MVGKFTSGVFNELLKGEAGLGKSALESARAQAKLFRDIFQRRTFTGHGSTESLLHLFADICARILSFQLRFEMRADHFQHFFVVGDKWCVQVRAPKNERVAVRIKTHAAAKMAFKESAMFRPAGEIDPERCDLAIS